MRLIRGAAGAGKTALVFDEFKQALRSGHTDLRIVVPTATLVRHFQHELARDGVVFSPKSVVSLNRFACERAPGVKLVPDGLLRAIVRDSLRRLNIPQFAEVAATQGMIETVIDTITLFENAGATPEKLAAVRKLSPLAKAFEKVWRAVDEAVRASGHQTRGGLLRAASANTETARVWLDGFLNFSQLESDFVRPLATSCCLTLTLPDSPAVDEIRRLALELGASDRLLAGLARKPQVAVIEAPGVERESDEIARRILALNENGIPFREVGVALRDTATYLPLLRCTFERFGVPARFYFTSALRQHPLATFLNGLIRGALTGWDFESALETLRAHPRWGCSADFDRFDFKVREAMPGRGAEALLELCESDWLRQQIEACLNIDEWLRAKAAKPELLRPADWQSKFGRLAANLYTPGTLDAANDYGEIESARSHVAALRSWLDAVQSATAFWPDPNARVSLTEFWDIASDAIESAVLRVPDDRADVVHVMSVYEARQWDVGHLFVCGMTDRAFPNRHPQNLLFPDSDIDSLRKCGIPLRKAEQETEEKWLFDSLRTRARDGLFLSFPCHDAAGKSVTRSRFLLEPGVKPVPVRACQPAATVVLQSHGTAGRVDSPALLAEMAALHRSISLTALEELALCRFRFFAGRTLGLSARPERPQERLQPRITGTILHETLDRWLADKTRDFVELFEETFDRACQQYHLQAGYRLEVERIQFRKIARKVSAQEQWNSDSSESEVALELEFPGPIAVKCRIDRIDRFGDDCIIIDYKSSKTANVARLVESRTRLQGPIYALAVREKKGLNPVAMLYWAVREDKLYGWGKIPGTAIENLLEMPDNWAADARARIIDRLGSFLGGAVRAWPEEPDQCRWCDFAAACRIEQQKALVMIEGAHAS